MIKRFFCAVIAVKPDIISGSGKQRGTILIGVCLVFCILTGTLAACQTGLSDGENPAEAHFYAEGYYLKCDNGSDMIVMDAEGEIPASPCRMTAADDTVSFKGLTDGDRIRIEVFLIQETYPAQTTVYSVEKQSDGERSDIDKTVLDMLLGLGWIENSIADKDYGALLSMTAGEIRQNCGTITLAYLENGGTPIAAVDSLGGVYLVYDDLTAPDFPALDIPDAQIAGEVIFNGQYGSNPAFPDAVFGLRIGDAVNETGITWDEADFHFINGTMFLCAAVGNYRLTAVVSAAGDSRMPNELTAADEDWRAWEDAFAKAPIGNIVQIRLAPIAE